MSDKDALFIFWVFYMLYKKSIILKDILLIAILRVSFYIWNLLQTISEARWNYFKILSQSNTLTLVKAMRTIDSSNLILMSSPNIKMAINLQEVTFTLVTNKKYKRKSKASSLLFIFFSDSRSKILLLFLFLRL